MYQCMYVNGVAQHGLVVKIPGFNPSAHDGQISSPKDFSCFNLSKLNYIEAVEGSNFIIERVSLVLLISVKD